MEDNKRGEARQKVLKVGRIVLDDLSTLDCGVRDLSATGAKLIIANPLVPDVFRLLIPGDNSIRPAEVAWRKPDQIGVRFTGEAKKSVLRRT
jgi:hypothetical protein